MRVQTYPFAPRCLKEFTVNVPEKYNWGFDQVDRLGREMGIKQGSMGVPGPLFDVEVVNENGRILGVGEEGNIGISTKPRPFDLFKEYANQPDKTAEVFHHGWYSTGHKASREAEGYFWFIGRTDDVIKSSGYRIGPFEVESA